MTAKNILVTGGAGFIGSNFIRYIFDEFSDCQIVNLDLLTYAGNLENLRGLEGNANYSFYRGDIRDKKLVKKIFGEKNITHVVNFAAESHVDRSIMEPDVFTQTNIVGTNVLLDVFKEFFSDRTEDMVFLQVSTDEVYGSLGSTGYFTESTPLDPSSPYSASKAGADLITLAYHKTFGLPTVVTRCSNNYGPFQFPEKLIPLIIINAMQNKALPVYGDGKNIRDWLHVRDHSAALARVLFKGEAGEVYNIGGNNERENIEIVKKILSCLGADESLITYVQDRPGHDRRYAIDSSKIQRELGWAPLYSFEDAISETVHWFKDNREWWERIVSGEYRNYYNKQYQEK